MKIRKDFSIWMAGRKFALTVAFIAISLIGGAILYIFDNDSNGEALNIFTSTLEYILYSIITFSGIEGLKEGVQIFKPNRSGNQHSAHDQQ